jgi:hypothetical protein
MNKDTIPCCAADALWRIRQIRVNGVMTGISRLEESIANVQEENLTGEDAIRTALLKNARASNYIPPGAEDGYGAALMEEYRKAPKGAKRNTGKESQP